MKLHSGGTSTTFTSIARFSASSKTRMFTSVSFVAAMAMKGALEIAGRVLALLPVDRALLGQVAQRLDGIERDQGEPSPPQARSPSTFSRPTSPPPRPRSGARNEQGEAM